MGLLTYRINWIKKMMCYRHWFAVFKAGAERGRIYIVIVLNRP